MKSPVSVRLAQNHLAVQSEYLVQFVAAKHQHPKFQIYLIAQLVGQLNKFEIWDADVWQQQIEQDIQTEQQGDFELTERLQDFSL